MTSLDINPIKDFNKNRSKNLLLKIYQFCLYPIGPGNLIKINLKKKDENLIELSNKSLFIGFSHKDFLKLSQDLIEIPKTFIYIKILNSNRFIKKLGDFLIEFRLVKINNLTDNLSINKESKKLKNKIYLKNQKSLNHIKNDSKLMKKNLKKENDKIKFKKNLKIKTTINLKKKSINKFKKTAFKIKNLRKIQKRYQEISNLEKLKILEKRIKNGFSRKIISEQYRRTFKNIFKDENNSQIISRTNTRNTNIPYNWNYGHNFLLDLEKNLDPTDFFLQIDIRLLEFLHINKNLAKIVKTIPLKNLFKDQLIEIKIVDNLEKFFCKILEIDSSSSFNETNNFDTIRSNDEISSKNENSLESKLKTKTNETSVIKKSKEINYFSRFKIFKSKINFKNLLKKKFNNFKTKNSKKSLDEDNLKKKDSEKKQLNETIKKADSNLMNYSSLNSSINNRKSCVIEKNKKINSVSLPIEIQLGAKVEVTKEKRLRNYFNHIDLYIILAKENKKKFFNLRDLKNQTSWKYIYNSKKLFILNQSRLHQTINAVEDAICRTIAIAKIYVNYAKSKNFCYLVSSINDLLIQYTINSYQSSFNELNQLLEEYLYENLEIIFKTEMPACMMTMYKYNYSKYGEFLFDYQIHLIIGVLTIKSLNLQSNENNYYSPFNSNTEPSSFDNNLDEKLKKKLNLFEHNTNELTFHSFDEISLTNKEKALQFSSKKITNSNFNLLGNMAKGFERSTQVWLQYMENKKPSSNIEEFVHFSRALENFCIGLNRVFLGPETKINHNSITNDKLKDNEKLNKKSLSFRLPRFVLQSFINIHQLIDNKIHNWIPASLKTLIDKLVLPVDYDDATEVSRRNAIFQASPYKDIYTSLRITVEKLKSLHNESIQILVNVPTIQCWFPLNVTQAWVSEEIHKIQSECIFWEEFFKEINWIKNDFKLDKNDKNIFKTESKFIDKENELKIYLNSLIMKKLDELIKLKTTDSSDMIIKYKNVLTYKSDSILNSKNQVKENEYVSKSSIDLNDKKLNSESAKNCFVLQKEEDKSKNFLIHRAESANNQNSLNKIFSVEVEINNPDDKLLKNKINFEQIDSIESLKKEDAESLLKKNDEFSLLKNNKADMFEKRLQKYNNLNTAHLIKLVDSCYENLIAFVSWPHAVFPAKTAKEIVYCIDLVAVILKKFYHKICSSSKEKFEPLYKNTFEKFVNNIKTVNKLLMNNSFVDPDLRINVIEWTEYQEKSWRGVIVSLQWSKTINKFCILNENENVNKLRMLPKRKLNYRKRN